MLIKLWTPSLLVFLLCSGLLVCGVLSIRTILVTGIVVYMVTKTNQKNFSFLFLFSENQKRESFGDHNW
jgi:hypothetical protein